MVSIARAPCLRDLADVGFTICRSGVNFFFSFGDQP